MPFDAVVIVDWSGASVPRTGRDSIWVGVARVRKGSAELAEPVNIPTRLDAEAYIAALLAGFVNEGSRTLVGFDFPYSYPRGLADALGLPSSTPRWRAIWDLLLAEVHDGARNENDRFGLASRLNARIGPGPGPFWGCPPKAETSFLQARHKSRWDFPYALPAGGALARLRECEKRMQGVQETWKLLGAGSVGSQALLGIPVVARLRDHPAFRHTSRVWPFETGFEAGRGDAAPGIVHAEIWPGSVPLDTTLHPVRDAAQVLTLARKLAAQSTEGALGPWFRGPTDQSAGFQAQCMEEEGWILGAG